MGHAGIPTAPPPAFGGGIPARVRDPPPSQPPSPRLDTAHGLAAAAARYLGHLTRVVLSSPRAAAGRTASPPCCAAPEAGTATGKRKLPVALLFVLGSLLLFGATFTLTSNVVSLVSASKEAPPASATASVAVAGGAPRLAGRSKHIRRGRKHAHGTPADVPDARVDADIPRPSNPNTCRVPKDPVAERRPLHRENRRRVLAALREAINAGRPGVRPGDVLILAGSSHQYRSNTQTAVAYRQDASFLHATGVHDVADAVLVVAVPSGHAELFFPDLTRQNLIFEGGYGDLEDRARAAEVDAIQARSDLLDILEDPEGPFKARRVYVMDSAEALLTAVPELRSANVTIIDGEDSWRQHEDEHGGNPAATRSSEWIDARSELARYPDLLPVQVADPEDLLDLPTFEPVDRLNGTHTPHLGNIVRSVRLVKSPTEIERIAYAAAVSCEAHNQAMQNVATKRMHEYHVESVVSKALGVCGLRHHAYEPIVGAGDNGAILHYVANSDSLEEGDLLVLDAAGEHRGYAADLTRTFPVSGKFTPIQREVYDIVLEAQLEAVAASRPGITFAALGRMTRQTLTRLLLEAGYLQNGTVEELMQLDIISTFLPHGLGHSIGLDVHDPQPRDWTLAPGHVLTIEPGLYFIDFLLEEARTHPSRSKYYNFDKIDQIRGGIRIEDVVVVQPLLSSGATQPPVVLTSTSPKFADDIEKLMAE
ncbi:hypothetical protein H696_01966 [Fonticula alba]|uniref:Aminopeptidase P N-terminal domain-containing protein n=1 Tax=Fonticula alba TaxID=691883 RepID=A0A058Z9W9_FONAL|nr:hypothetical protein H696_01966 [Fonticula alba]KCV71020.1 hypothetical protein H696_01966 [Fonticula alba]|eukprot:XP_009494143.1 hypothetical protein H696_01966 [Fonticula alba]